MINMINSNTNAHNPDEHEREHEHQSEHEHEHELGPLLPANTNTNTNIQKPARTRTRTCTNTNASPNAFRNEQRSDPNAFRHPNRTPNAEQCFPNAEHCSGPTLPTCTHVIVEDEFPGLSTRLLQAISQELHVRICLRPGSGPWLPWLACALAEPHHRGLNLSEIRLTKQQCSWHGQDVRCCSPECNLLCRIPVSHLPACLANSSPRCRKLQLLDRQHLSVCASAK